jgi:photosystem II stability/assembly factor-like uncharacterized protein
VAAAGLSALPGAYAWSIAGYTLVAATRAGVVRVAQQKAGWRAEPALAGHDVRCLTTAGRTLFAGTQAGDVHRSSDGGRSWSAFSLGGEPVKSLVASEEALYAGTKEPRVHVSLDGGESWRALGRFSRPRSWWWAQPAERPFRPSYVSALAVTPEAIIAGIEACGVFRSTDGGNTWSVHRRGALRDCHELLCDGRNVYEAGAGGLAASSDGGRTWRRLREGLDCRYGWSVAFGEETLYLAVAPYRSAHTDDSRARVYRARGDSPWEPCTDELESLPRLRAAGGDVFAALGDGTLLYSADRGDSWTKPPVSVGGPSFALLALRQPSA